MELIFQHDAFTELISQHVALTELISQHVAFTELISQHVAVTELISQHVAFIELISQHVAITELLSQHVAFTELISAHGALQFHSVTYLCAAGKNKGGKGIKKHCSLCTLAGRVGLGHRKQNCPYVKVADEQLPNVRVVAAVKEEATLAAKKAEAARVKAEKERKKTEKEALAKSKKEASDAAAAKKDTNSKKAKKAKEGEEEGASQSRQDANELPSTPADKAGASGKRRRRTIVKDEESPRVKLASKEMQRKAVYDSQKAQAELRRMKRATEKLLKAGLHPISETGSDYGDRAEGSVCAQHGVTESSVSTKRIISEHQHASACHTHYNPDCWCMSATNLGVLTFCRLRFSRRKRASSRTRTCRAMRS